MAMTLDEDLRHLRQQRDELQRRGTELVEECRRLKAERPDREADVRLFFATCKQETDAATTPRVPSDESLRLGLRLIAEEFFELLEACCPARGPEIGDAQHLVGEVIKGAYAEDVDLPELADATIDIDYLTEGLRIRCGISGAPLWRAVQAANLSKLGGGRRADGKIQKPEGWRAPPIQELLMAQGWEGK